MTARPTLSADLLERADRAGTLAKLLAEAVPEAAQQLAYLAATLGLLHLRAATLERELAASRRTLNELRAQAAEEADLVEAAARAADPARAGRWQRRARIIATLLPAQPGGTGEPTA